MICTHSLWMANLCVAQIKHGESDRKHLPLWYKASVIPSLLKNCSSIQLLKVQVPWPLSHQFTIMTTNFRILRLKTTIKHYARTWCKKNGVFIKGRALQRTAALLCCNNRLPWMCEAVSLALRGLLGSATGEITWWATLWFPVLQYGVWFQWLLTYWHSLEHS